MKILQINSVCGIRSTGRIAADLAEKYMSEGHECIIAYGRENVPDKYRNISYRIGNELGVRFNAALARILDNEGFNAKRETKKFIKWANNYNPDVLWLHNLHGYYINIELLFKWIKSRPEMEVRWLLHDCWAFTGHCAHFSYIQCEQWKTLCNRCRQKWEYPKSILHSNCNHNYLKKKECFCGVKKMTLVTPSYWLANLISKSFLSDYNVEVVHNTIDDNVFSPTLSNFRKKYHLENKIIILGVASTWSEKKGFYDFIRLSKSLDTSFIIVLVGLTGRQQRELPNNILGLPPTNSAKELAEIYTAADIFLNLTYEDTFPTVNLESQACGTPCITYRTGGSIESVPPENIVNQGDVEALIVKLRELKGQSLQ